MSAICGIIHFDGKPVDHSELEVMAESSPWLGPDGTGFHVVGNAGFAHLAFQVTPESVDERQPLVSEDGRYVMVADVRLDNREELVIHPGVGVCLFDLIPYLRVTALTSQTRIITELLTFLK